MRITVVLSLVVLLLFGTAYPQARIELSNIQVTTFPEVKADLLVIDEHGLPRTDLTTSELSVFENGEKREITKLELAPSQTTVPYSIVVCIDASTAMKDELGALSAPLKNFLRQQVSVLGSECAVMCVSSTATVLQDFTHDTDLLSAAVDNIHTGQPGSMYDALLTGTGSAFKLAAAGKNAHKMVLVVSNSTARFTTDQRSQLLSFCKVNNLVVSNINLAGTAPGIAVDLAMLTHGVNASVSTTNPNITAAFDRVFVSGQSWTAHRLYWQTENLCTPGRYCWVTTANGSLSSAWETYFAKNSTVRRLDFQPAISNLGVIPPNASATVHFLLNSVVSDHHFTGITSDRSEVTFSSLPAFPASLHAGESIAFDAEVHPTDSEKHIARISLETDACSRIGAIIEWGQGVPSGSAIQIVTPVGPDTLIAGERQPISWIGALGADSLYLESSTDSGSTWEPIATTRGIDSVVWQVPNVETDSCVLRVRQLCQTSLSARDTLKADNLSIRKTVWFAHDSSLLILSDTGVGPSMRPASKITRWDLASKTVAWSVIDSPRAYNVTVSSDNKLVAVWYGTSGYLRLYDARTGSIFHSWTDTDRVVSGCSFSPDGRTLAVSFITISAVTHSWEANYIACYDLTTLAPLFSKQVGSSPTGYENYEAKFSPDGRKIATVDFANVISEWSAEDGSLIHKYDYSQRDDSLVVSFTAWGEPFYSRDGRYILSASYPLINNWARPDSQWSGLPIWDVQTHKLDFSKPFAYLGVRQSFGLRPDWEIYGMGAWDGRVELFDFRTANLLVTLSEAVDSILAVGDGQFSSDGQEFCAGFNDGRILIWRIGVLPILSDETHARLRIVRPRVRTVDLDFGSVPVNTIVDRTNTSFLLNVGTVRGTLNMIDRFGSDTTEITCLSPTQVSGLLGPGDSISATFRFSPTRTGQQSVKYRIVTSVDTLWATISGEGVLPEVVGKKDNLDFGRVDVGSTVDSIYTEALRNVGGNSVRIDSVVFVEAGPTDFSIAEPIGTLTLLAGETLSPRVRFSPDRPGETSGGLLFYHSGVGSPTLLRLFGSARGATVIAPVDSARIGTTVTLPISVSGPTAYLTKAGVVSVEADVSYLRSVLRPLTQVDTLPSASEAQTIRVRGTWSPGTTTIAHLPTMRVLLGDTAQTPLAITNMNWFDAQGKKVLVDVGAQDGVFSVMGSENLLGGGSDKLLLPSPNPTRGSIRFEYVVAEAGRTTITIFDDGGREVATLLDRTVESGPGVVSITSSALSSGAYTCVLKTSRGNTTTRFVVVK